MPAGLTLLSHINIINSNNVSKDCNMRNNRPSFRQYTNNIIILSIHKDSTNYGK